MHDVMTLDLSRIAQDLQIRKVQVESVVQLLDEGNTVPFITRYRKEQTGGLNEEVIRKIQARVQQLHQLAERKQTILKSIEGQGKLTDELRNAILAAETPKRLEDLYLPYKPKKRSLATTARERGLEPLALAIWTRDPAVAKLDEVLPTMVNPEKELAMPADVLQGVQHILAELIAETADVRAAVRSILWETGRLCTSKSENLGEGQGLDYKDYFQFTEPARQIPPHRILAINRGEKEGTLKVRLEWDAEAVRRVLFTGMNNRSAVLPLVDHPHAEFLKTVAEDALARLLLPSLEREIRRELTEEAQEHAVAVFARNLRSLLLQPPLRGRRVLAIDPGFRTGCKIAALDETGNLLEEGVIFLPGMKGPSGKGRGPRGWRGTKAETAAPPTASADQPPLVVAAGAASAVEQITFPPDSGFPVSIALPPMPMAVSLSGAALVTSPAAEPANSAQLVTGAATSTWPQPPPAQAAKAKLAEIIRQHQVHVIAIGNGTACRETEELVSELIAEKLPDLAYVIVNEAGASVYSASAIGREEFPNYDATLRGTISIGRRLQDPLSELVKIDPQNIGVGLYQHDVNPRQLKESLDGVIESCVNHVGVDLNTASVPLLRHVAGLNQLVARELVEYRKQNGPFKSREQLQHVPSVGPARYVQAAGFLRIIGGACPLDRTSIHPESYLVVRQLLAELGCAENALEDRQRTEELREKFKALSPEEVSAQLGVGVPTLRDILEALARPGRDPREDLPPPIFKKGILKLEHLQPGMELKGTVLNVVDFGAFIDIGLKDSGLVHISQMANRYIKSAYDVVSVGDVVKVWVLAVDQERRRVSLTLMKPGTERKPPERKPQQHRSPRGQPPRGRQAGPPRRQGQATPAASQEPASAAATAAAPPPPKHPPRSGPPPRPGQRPRKPQRSAPLPKLSQAALKGAVPLRTFGELEAFFKAAQAPPAAPAQAAEQAATAPGPEPAAAEHASEPSPAETVEAAAAPGQTGE